MNTNKQREIKFRAWNKVKKEMFYVHEIGWIGSMLTLAKESQPNVNNIHTACNFVSSVLMQYTGLKDKNGKEIYEGDIVRTYHLDEKGNREERIFDVEFHFNPFRGVYMYIEERGEIIGNIYETPNLLT